MNDIVLAGSIAAITVVVLTVGRHRLRTGRWGPQENPHCPISGHRRLHGAHGLHATGTTRDRFTRRPGHRDRGKLRHSTYRDRGSLTLTPETRLTKMTPKAAAVCQVRNP